MDNIIQIADAWLRYLMSTIIGHKNPTKEIQKYVDLRFKTCMSCPHMIIRTHGISKRTWRRCGKCGCAFPAMIFAYEKRCPDGRWDVLPADVISASESE